MPAPSFLFYLLKFNPWLLGMLEIQKFRSICILTFLPQTPCVCDLSVQRVHAWDQAPVVAFNEFYILGLISLALNLLLMYVFVSLSPPICSSTKLMFSCYSSTNTEVGSLQMVSVLKPSIAKVVADILLSKFPSNLSALLIVFGVHVTLLY